MRSIIPRKESNNFRLTTDLESAETLSKVAIDWTIQKLLNNNRPALLIILLPETYDALQPDRNLKPIHHRCCALAEPNERSEHFSVLETLTNWVEYTLSHRIIHR